MTQYVDTMFDETKKIHHTALELRRVANALHYSGNVNLASDLNYISDDLITSSEELILAVKTELGRSFKDTNEMTNSLIELALNSTLIKETSCPTE